ncbi:MULTISPECIES: hypothetical protein [unclassified Methanoregula]|uniref:hypothetical protein n=1 Tax=unclassified Methanoregula TaxID=2649730 RepID=UPI0009C6643A|nr:MULTISPECIES: hypothetical protein [unclassified Methanoregula]OPX62551.1 MAG: hypothetical protein A4E33_02300 [Methanoregula sp. PtaB.Bin085]OPY31650.1 MAG: hypothetical protein A4E34_02843 [Methanoregula sp. PtaU1.Bin006]
MERNKAITVAIAIAGLLLVAGILFLASGLVFMNCASCLPFMGQVTQSGSDAVIHLYYSPGCYRGGCGVHGITLDDVQALQVEIIPEGPGAGERIVREFPASEFGDKPEILIPLNDTLTPAWRTLVIATMVYKDGVREQVAYRSLGPEDTPSAQHSAQALSARFIPPAAGGDVICAVQERGAYFPDEGFGWGTWFILYANGTGLSKSYNFRIDKTVPEPGKRRVLTEMPAGNVTISTETTDRIFWSESGGVLTIDLAGIRKEYVATRDAAGIITAVKAK